tara:strand:- start:1720 stop:1968 length:249 start_codon:yes stop_codon:yes gene_type:complete
MIDRESKYMTMGLANTTLDVLNPSRSVIVDMIMVQFIASFITMLMLLVFKGDEMGSQSASYLLVGLFGSLLMITGIFSRINK